MHIPDGLVQMLTQHVEHVGVHSVHQWLFIGDGGLPPYQKPHGLLVAEGGQGCGALKHPIA